MELNGDVTSVMLCRVCEAYSRETGLPGPQQSPFSPVDRLPLLPAYRGFGRRPFVRQLHFTNYWRNVGNFTDLLYWRTAAVERIRVPPVHRDGSRLPGASNSFGYRLTVLLADGYGYSEGCFLGNCGCVPRLGPSDGPCRVSHAMCI